MIKSNKSIGIITPPIGRAGLTPLFNLSKIVQSFSSKNILITGDDIRHDLDLQSNVRIIGVKYHEYKQNLLKIFNHIYIQLTISYYILNFRERVHIWIFFLDSHSYILPVVMAKLTRKKIYFLLAASIRKSSKSKKSKLTSVLLLSEYINFFFADVIIAYSKKMIKEWNLEHFKKKIVINYEHHVNTAEFKEITDFLSRQNIVGYVGRLSHEKGILNFVQATCITQKMKNIKFLVIGDGELRATIENYLNENNLNDKVEIIGWITHNELPKYFNMMKLIVIPSYTEGLPNIMLEAMACGTPVLTAPVGVIPDVVIDEKTGFLMENNSPKCIALNIERVFNHPDLATIANNAKNLVKKEFTFEAAVKRFTNILGEI